MQNSLNNIKTNTVISSPELTLKSIEEEDLELIRTWRNKDSIRLSFINNSIISEESQRKWFKTYKEKYNDIMFIILHKESNTKIGSVALYDIDINTGTAEFGRLMIGAYEYRGNNYGTKATLLITDFAFKELHINNIILYVFKDNIAAIKTYEDAGFIASPIDSHDYKILKMTLKP